MSRAASQLVIAFVLLCAMSRIASAQVSQPSQVSQVTQAKKPERTNFILILIDDMGWSDLSCFGNNQVSTDNMDRLAKEGIRFKQFYVNAPICSPSRTAITTGHYPQRWRIHSYLNNRKDNARRGLANGWSRARRALREFFNRRDMRRVILANGIWAASAMWVKHH